MKKTLAGLVLVSIPAGAQERIDTSRISVKKAIADTMNADELQAYKELLAERQAAGDFGRTPADICSAAACLSAAHSSNQA